MTISVEEKDDKTSVLQHVTYACKLHKLEEGFSYCIAGYIYSHLFNFGLNKTQL